MSSLRQNIKLNSEDFPWVDSLPSNWNVCRLRNVVEMLVSNVDKIKNESEFPVRLCNYVDVYKNDRITEKLSFMVASATKEEINQFRLHRDDVIITKDSEMWNDIGVPSLVMYTSDDLICGYHLAILRAQKDKLLGSYLFRVLQGRDFQIQFFIAANGVTRYGLSQNSIKSVLVPVPPLDEQEAIVRFLDHTDRKIKHYIRAKQKLIKLLNEQKQAIIHQAVTRGLDTNLRLKPSGVEWLGDVPINWSVQPLKRCVSTKITDGPHESPEFLDSGIPFMSAESMVNGHLDFSHKRGYISRETHDIYCKKCFPRLNDIFMCKSGATTGKVAIVETNEEFSIWSPLALIRANQKIIIQELLFYILQSKYVQRQVQTTWSYGTQPNLSMGAMEKLVIAIPPIEDQMNILGKIKFSIDKIEKIVSFSYMEISTIRDYLSRLISDVITGKVDIRKAAAQLPDILEEPQVEIEPLEEDDAIEVEELQEMEINGDNYET